jgi:hypothetical protein
MSGSFGHLGNPGEGVGGQMEFVSNKEPDDTARKAVADNLRFYADVRFKLFALFLTWILLLSGGLIQLSDKPAFAFVGRLIPVIGIVVTGVFWVLEVRTTLYWRAQRDIYPELWPRPRNNAWSYLNATNAISFLFLFVFVSWLFAAFHLGLHRAILAIFLGILALLITFTIQVYRK